jgi:dihydroneopterin aldolase
MMAPLDRIVIRQLQVPTVIGVYPFEREKPQTLRCDLVLWVDITQAALTDDLQYTIDYAAVSEQVRALAKASSYQLLEALGEHILSSLLAQFPRIHHIEMTLFKDGCIEHAQGSELMLTRARQ